MDARTPDWRVACGVYAGRASSMIVTSGPVGTVLTLHATLPTQDAGHEVRQGRSFSRSHVV